LPTPGGAPRDAAYRLTDAIKRVLLDAIARQSAADYRSDRLSRLRPPGSALPAAALRRRHPPPHPGRTVVVLLPCLSEVAWPAGAEAPPLRASGTVKSTCACWSRGAQDTSARR
jgi:hypothetical protein